MIQLKLERKVTEEISSPASAAWLPSSDPTDWLREASKWSNNGSSEDLKILPVTLTGEVKGALLLLPKATQWKFGYEAQPLLKVSKNVYTVEGAQLNASILDHEVDYLFPKHLYLFLPSLGLIAFDEEHALPPSAFIAALRSEATWNHAVPAPPPAPKLTAIIVPLPPEEDFNLEQLNEDGIGKDRDKKVKPSKNGPGFASKLGAGLGMGLAGLAAGPILGVGKLMSFLPAENQPPSHRNIPSDFEKLQDWARRNFKNLTDARQRELNKLMDLMEKDPEMGLRYALPLGGHEARRGRSTPSWQLGARSTHLGSRQGGSATDGWDLNYETRLSLERQYRKAAVDAEQDENFERAAYIYGELLNDWANAANTLKKAGRYRDAVGIYLHKLKDKGRAAECLEAASQRSQAAELYTELKKFEKAGDLYAQLELNQEARQSWQRAVENENNPIKKARITHSKLNDIDEAIHLLDKAWRTNNRPIDCIQKQFSLLYQADRETESIRLLEDFLDVDNSSLAPLQKAKICYTLRTEKQTKSIIHRAKEGILKLTSDSLTTAPNSGTTKELLKELPNLEQTDVLLSRDAARFSFKNTNIQSIKLSHRSGHLRPQLVSSIPGEAQWHSVAAIADDASVAGSDLSSLAFAKLKGSICSLEQLNIKDYPGGLQKVYHIGLKSSKNHAYVFHYGGAQKIHFQLSGRENNEIQNQLGAETNILAIGSSGRSDFISLRYTDTGALVLNYYDIHGAQYNTKTLDLAPPEIADARWYCAERSGHACFSANQFAAWRYPQGKLIPIQLYEPILKLTFSPSPQPVSAILCGETGLSLITPHKKEKEPEFINLYTSSNTHRPVGCYTNNGEIIVACGGEGLVFNRKQTLTPAATFSVPPDEGHPIDISAHGPRGFIILTSKAKLITYK